MSIGYIIRQAVAALLLPLCISAALAFGDMMVAQGSGPSAKGIHAGMALIIGVAAYAVIYVFLNKSILRVFFDRGPVQTVWGSITGYHLPDPRDGGKQAEVPVDAQGRRVPLWAAMAPYLFPIYAMLGVLVVWLVREYVYSMSHNAYAVVQAGVIGFTYATHVFMVANDIRTRQPALRAAGTFFTLTLLFLFNVEVLGLLAMLVFDADWLDFNRRILGGLQGQYEWAWGEVSSLWR